MSIWPAIPISILVAVLFGTWLVALYSMIRLLAHAKGNWFALLFRPGW